MPLPPAPIAPSARRAFVARAVLYSLLLVGGACTLGALRRTPQGDLDDLVAALRVADEQVGFYRQGGASVGVFPGRGWTLTLYVGDARAFAPTSYLVLTRIDGALRGELLAYAEGDQGRLQQSLLRGDALATYLERGELDLAALDATVASRWGAARGALPLAGK